MAMPVVVVVVVAIAIAMATTIAMARAIEMARPWPPAGAIWKLGAFRLAMSELGALASLRSQNAQHLKEKKLGRLPFSIALWSA